MEVKNDTVTYPDCFVWQAMYNLTEYKKMIFYHYFNIFMFAYEAVKYCHSLIILQVVLSKLFTHALLL